MAEITLRINVKRRELAFGYKQPKQVSSAQWKILMQTLHNEFYNKADDIFDLPSEIIEEGTRVGVK